jgi:hypothetical protein
MRSHAFAVAVALLLLPDAAARGQAAPQSSPVIHPVPAARAADVESIDAIVTALYDVISGPAGQPRDWNRMRSLFVPGGRLMPTLPRQGGGTNLRVLEVNDYIALSGANLERTGFTEVELFRRTEQYGSIAHVFSTYEGRREVDPTVIRGINSIQLMYDGTRWWILSVFWEAERSDNPLPPEYLPPAG